MDLRNLQKHEMLKEDIETRSNHLINKIFS
jgi:hypothetical protein